MDGRDFADNDLHPATAAGAATADATMRSDTPSRNCGADTPLLLAYGGAANVQAPILVRFDLSGLPAGAVIDSAVMGLWQEDSVMDPGVIASALVTSTGRYQLENHSWGFTVTRS